MKESSMIRLVIFSFVAFLVTRGFMEAVLCGKLSRKGYKAYKAKTNLLDRWFFISARHIVRDKYSKFEGRIIRHTMTVRIMFALNLILHVAFLPEQLLLLMVELNVLNNQVADGAATVFFIVILVVWLSFYFIEGYENRKYHRMRERRR